MNTHVVCLACLAQDDSFSSLFVFVFFVLWDLTKPIGLKLIDFENDGMDCLSERCSP